MADLIKYSVQIQWSDEDDCYIATAEELPHVSAFGDTYDEALREFKDAMSVHLEVLGEENQPEPLTLESYSGQFRVRLPKSLHRRLATLARRENVSLNTLVIKLLSESTTAVEMSDRVVRGRKAGVYSGSTRVEAVSEPQPSKLSTKTVKGRR